MRAVLQRVSQAIVQVNNSVVGQIEWGYVVLLGIEQEDTPEDIEWLCKKIVNLRVFADDTGNMNRSIKDIDGQILLISQFTLHAQVKKGNRPSFIKAAPPSIAEPLYEQTITQLSSTLGQQVETGIFGAHMNINLTNDGPVTIWIDTKNRQ